ncbi:unnamed protein product [Protopolystoma xenopodis]|uniref:Uncharacterized protein n=1 Tax=Protopolystoma xenopodis TaxID=117903 RepID=A0A448WEV8_9PLAT|nr:unnamed protein product [Protopolystoma xenopodis]
MKQSPTGPSSSSPFTRLAALLVLTSLVWLSVVLPGQRIAVAALPRELNPSLQNEPIALLYPFGSIDKRGPELYIPHMGSFRKRDLWGV